MDKGFNLWVRGYDNEGYEDAYNRFLELAKKHGLSGADSYRRLAGEVEARNVQSRMYLSDEMRRRSHASQTEDVPRDEQIVIYRDGAAEAEEKSRSSERGRAQSQTATSSENLNQTGTDAEYKSAVESGDMEEGAAYGRESDKSRNALSGKINNGASEFNSEEKAIFASDKELQKEWIDKNIEELVKSYDNGNVFDPDEIRKLLSPIGYDGNDVASYKDAQEILNNAILDKMLADAVASGNPTVTLLSGLPGSGKSFAARKFADNLNLGGRGLVVDKPFNSYDSIVELYEKAKEKGIDDINIVAIYCDPVRNVKNIISRGKRQGRWTPIEYWLMNFKKQSDKLKRLSEEYPDIKLTAIENTADGESIFYDDATKAHDWKFELTDEQKDEIINFIQQDYEIDRTFAKEAIRAINETRTRTNNEIVSGPVDGGGRTHDIRGDSGQVRNAERVTAARKPYGAPVTEQKKIEPSENIMADTSDTSAVRNAKNALAENKRKGEDVTNKPQAVRDAEQTVVNYFKEQIDKKWMDAMSKLKLNRMLSIFPHLNAKNQVKMMTRAEGLVRDMEIEHLESNIERMMKLKVQDKNNQGVSVAKTVDDETRQVFKILRDYTNTADATEHDDAVRDIRRKLWHEYRNRKEALEDYGEDSKEYNAVQNRIDGLKAELTPLGAAQQETRFAGYGKTAAEIDNYL